jgi:ArsR family transcriptional regulator
MFISKRCGCKTEKILSPINSKQLSKLSDDLSVISVKSRLELLFLLQNKPHCVCDLIEHTGKSQSLISHHLSDLEMKGYISKKRNGKFIDYLLTQKGSKVLKALELLVDITI